MTLYDESGQLGAWRDRATCLGMDAAVFYPHPVMMPSTLDRYDYELRAEREAPAKAVCRECEVREACLDFAVRTGQRDGIWGGLNAGERAKVRQAQGVGR